MTTEKEEEARDEDPGKGRLRGWDVEFVRSIEEGIV